MHPKTILIWESSELGHVITELMNDDLGIEIAQARPGQVGAVPPLAVFSSLAHLPAAGICRGKTLVACFDRQIDGYRKSPDLSPGDKADFWINETNLNRLRSIICFISGGPLWPEVWGNTRWRECRVVRETISSLADRPFASHPCQSHAAAIKWRRAEFALLFKQHLGIPLHRCVALYRIFYFARAYMQTDRPSINAGFAMLGEPTRNRFCDYFTRHAGLGIRDFRKAAQKQHWLAILARVCTTTSQRVS